MSSDKRLKKLVDNKLYRLADVEVDFSISVDELIRGASKANDPIRLCFELRPGNRLMIADSKMVESETKKFVLVLRGDTSIKTIYAPECHAVNDVSAAVVRWIVCSKLKSVSSLSMGVIDDVYIRDEPDLSLSDNTRYEMVACETYASRVRLRQGVAWRFYIFEDKVPLGSWLPPISYTLVKSELCIYGFELRKYILGLQAPKGQRTIVGGVGAAGVNEMKFDEIRPYIVDAVRDLVVDGKMAGPKSVMKILRGWVDRDPVIVDFDSVGLRWIDSSGNKVLLDEVLLKGRLAYLRKTQPQLFTREHYLREDDEA